MLAPYPARPAPQPDPRHSRARLRIYLPPSPTDMAAETPSHRAEPRSIGELLPLVLARYLSPDKR
jgi:hypothetical protein